MTRDLKAHNDAGFTLVEALVAAAVLAVISMLLAPALIGAVTAAARSQSLTAKIEERAALDAVFHEVFASTHQPAAGDTSLLFSGASNAVTFLVRPQGGSVQQARLELGEGRVELSLGPDQNRPGTPVEDTTRVVLIEGFEVGRLSYIGLDQTRRRTVERSIWSQAHPPRLVVMVLDWPDGAQTRIQALVTGEGRFDCRFDSGRGLCLGDSY